MEDLFEPFEPSNLLPCDGVVLYQSGFLKHAAAGYLFRHLADLSAWQHDEVKMFGKVIVTARKVIWFGDSDCSYTYSGVKKSPEPWEREMLNLKEMVESELSLSFNSCLANLYHHGNEGMGWHSDDEPELGMQPDIAVVSLGADRKFKFKHKESKQVVDLCLQHGSLLLMQGESQSKWWHSLPKSKRISEPRISLTFRRIIHSRKS